MPRPARLAFASAKREGRGWGFTIRNLCDTLPFMFNYLSKNKKTAVFITASAVLIFGAVAFALWTKSRAPAAENISGNVLPPVAGLSPSPAAGGNVAGLLPPSGALPPYRGEAVGKINPDQLFLAHASQEKYQNFLKELAGLASDLASNPGQTEKWQKVAFIKHNYGDNIGARDAYEYLNIISPNDPVSFYNLAVIYGYDLKQPAKAIPKFEAALKLDPVNIGFYYGLANFYRDVAKDLSRAEQVLLEGIAKTPPDASLTSLLASIYKDKGDISHALEYYEKALKDTGLNQGSREAIEAEIGKLKNL